MLKWFFIGVQKQSNGEMTFLLTNVARKIENAWAKIKP